MIRKLLFCLSFSFLFLWPGSNEVFAQLAYWAQKAGGITPDEGIDISIDANGNTYTTGYFTGSATFGTTTLNSSGVTDVFLSKTDNLGVFEWTIKAGGSGSDRGFSIKTDAQGNSYITGYYYGTATFGIQSITSLGVQDVFIAKYDNTGTLIWVKSAGGTSADIGNGITIDNSGNVIITGEFTGTATFGGFSLTSMNNSVDVFTAKLDASGNFLWAKKGSAHDIDRGLDVACDAGGNVYITGQFTDTITFDVVHNNNMYNAIFVVKYNSNGEEQWFRKIGAGSMNVVGGIAVDDNSNVYLTGDFTGNVIFFGTTNTTLTNPYPNRIFVAKYTTAGDLLWAEADGSSSEITSKNLALDDDGNPYIVGNFKCRLNEYADVYGQGTFNSVGYWDIFVSKYNTAGVWQFSRSCGGKQDDYGSGITLNAAAQIHTTGSFFLQLVFPAPTNFLGYNTPSVYNGGSYCGEPGYNIYKGLNSSGNSDIFISKKFDQARAPYDYYRRPLTGCDRDYKGVCINGSITYCPDSVSFCSQGNLFAFSYITPAGPAFLYDWNPGGGGNSTVASTSGYYSITQSSVDGCFTSTDSIYVNVFPAPPIPTITDNLDTNINAIVTNEVFVCAPDSVLLTGGGFGANPHGWFGPNDTNNLAIMWADTSGQYEFTYTDINGCERSNTVLVTIQDTLPIIIPGMYNIPLGDSIAVCEGEIVGLFVYDSLTHPLGGQDTSLPCIQLADVTWTITASGFFEMGVHDCNHGFVPTHTDDYLVEAMIIRKNNCDTDTTYVTRSIYIVVNPVPVIAPITLTITLVGHAALCPGDSALLIASAAPNYLWAGPGGVTGNTNDSVWVFVQGSYIVSSEVSDTNSFGCSASASAMASQVITSSTQPTVLMNPANGLMCPNDSVRLQCSGTGLFQWYGPSGPIGTNNAVTYVNTPGFYFCVRTDANGCELLSNSVEVNQYATPFLLVAPDAALCDGDTALITVITNPGSTIQWQGTLSGSSLTQTITQPGIYTCRITSCGIQTLATAEVVASTLTAQITPDGPLEFCDGDSVILYANSGQPNYLWQPVSSPDTAIVVHQSGTYILTVSDNSGCTDTDEITVTVTPDTIIPALSLSPGNILCNDDSVIISVVANPGSPVQWQAPLSGTDTFQVVNAAGTYSCIITSCGTPVQQSVTITAVTVVATITADGQAVFCEGGSVTLHSSAVTETTTWQLIDSDTTVIGDSIAYIASQSGIYMLSITDTNGCKANDTITVTSVPNTLGPPLVADTAICPEGYAILKATGTGEMTWYDVPSGGTPISSGNTFTTPTLSAEAVYFVMQQDELCKSEKADVTVTIADCGILMAPNVFSPNNDGVNDEFMFPLTGATCFDCKIYNRWGRLLYEWTDAGSGWDGTNMHNGTVVNDGVYYYVLRWCDYKDAQKKEAGFIQLLK